MKKYEFQTRNIISEIKRSNEYNHYHRILKKIMQNEELYAKISEFRRKVLIFQLEKGEDVDRKIDELRYEYEEMLNQALVMEFLVAEQRLTKMGREITASIYEALDLEINFLDQ